MSALLTTAQAAQRLGIAESTVKLLLREGRLKGEKHGRDWIIPADTLAGAVIHKRGRPKREAT